jgi:hypothetical protein
MTKHITTVVAAFLLLAACQKTQDAPLSPNTGIPASVIATIQSHGFNTTNLQKTAGGYLVEGDILYTEENLRTGPQNSMLPLAEQYRAFNLVTGLPRTITIRLATNLNTTFWNNALQSAVNRYNALNLRLTFQKVATGAAAQITITGISGTGAQAGLPSNGNPYPAISIGTGLQSCGANTAITVIAHEIGHCIGFKHTDWFSLASCTPPGSGGTGGNVHIPGTPTSVDPLSWMLGCINCGTNRPFSTYDIVALNYLY